MLVVADGVGGWAEVFQLSFKISMESTQAYIAKSWFEE
jgi:hypothetical protein